MKNSFCASSLMLILCFAFQGRLIAQNVTDATAGKSISQLIDQKTFSFIAQYADPQGGREMFLTSTYSLTVKGDSLIGDLPYYGRAYVAPLNPQDAGIHFTTTNFEYNIKITKRGRYIITLKIKDEKSADQMMLTVFKNGTASLQVNSINRQSINYRGIVESITE